MVIHSILLLEFAFNLYVNYRFRHSSGFETEAHTDAAAHASWCRLGFQQQRASAAPGQLISLHSHGHRHPAHLHPAGCFFTHWYSQTGGTMLGLTGRWLFSYWTYLYKYNQLFTFYLICAVAASPSVPKRWSKKSCKETCNQWPEAAG